jgi:GNAT superfamily N-acetyltransferase
MIQIRRALPADAEAVSQIAIAAKWHWQYPERWMELWIPQLTFPPAYFEEHENWVAELDDTPVAFYTWQTRAENAWLENLWVTPECIGRGIGSRLFAHALDLSRQRGCHSMQTEAEPNAVGFYEKVGMRKIGEHQYDLDGQPRILPLMEMEL